MPRKRIRRPDHQTVVAYLALFLVLATGTAYAAATIGSDDVVNGSLKSIDLKNNGGVKGADVATSSLTSGDFRGSSLNGTDIAADSLGGGKVSEASLLASRIVARLGGVTNHALAGAPVLVPLPNPSYTQAANQPNELVGGVQVTFSAACTQPRGATVFLLNSPVLSGENIIGITIISDSGAGAATRHGSFNPFSGPAGGLTWVGSDAAVSRALYMHAYAGCNSGSGVTLDTAGVDVVGHR